MVIVSLSSMAVAVWVMTQHQDPVGHSLSSLPKASIPSVSPSISRPLCSPFARNLCLWLSPLVINLVTLHSAVRFRHHKAGAVFLACGAVVSLQAAAAWRGVVCLSTMAHIIWGMTQHRVPCGYSLSSFPKASVPSLSSHLQPTLLLPLLEPQVNDSK